MTILAALLASFSLFTTAAHADPKKEKNENYGYTFSDDALLGNDLGNQFGMIKVRQGSVRDRLIRPRTQFVAEMLKSVENL
jgi:hypothetical protein